MAREGSPVTLPAASARPSGTGSSLSLKGGASSLAPGKTGNLTPNRSARSVATKAPAATPDSHRSQALTAALNKVLNDSGKPTQFRLDPTSDNKVIQQINPVTGEVVAQFEVREFPALAGGLGALGVLVDSRV